MRAVVHDRYGPPEVLRVDEVERPVPFDDEVLVRVHATTVTRTDGHMRAARPFIWRFMLGLRRPRKRILGLEFAGVVEAVGSTVTEFSRGNRVFGLRNGSHAEYVCVREAGLLARVRATSVNIAEWYAVVGRPWIARPTMGFRRPRDIRIGVDYAGVVEAVGKGVTEFRPGDDVFGGRSGAYAEYVTPKAERAIVKKPDNVTFEQAGAVGTAAITALQGLRDKGGLQPGQRVLIYGASGGVGTYAVQIAKALGGEVTAVCSAPNVEIARSLGADLVVDYEVEDVTRRSERYDLVLDIAGTRSFSELRRVLEPHATVVVVGGPRANRLLGPLGHVVVSRIAAIRGSQRATFFIAKFNRADMEALRDLLEAGKLTSIVDSTYPLDEIADALRHMGEGHPRGKIVVTV